MRFPEGFLSEVVEELISSTHHGAPPQLVADNLKGLAEPHPGISIELVWERQELGHHHFDALITQSGGTVALSYASADDVPWPLRGSRRWSESDLLRVDETTITVGEAIFYLDVIWEQEALMQRLTDHCILRAELHRQKVSVSDSELQEGLDSFRRGRALYSEVDARSWMAAHGIGHHQLELAVEVELKIRKLRARIAASHPGMDETEAVEDWLHRRRQQAKIEWLWGPATRDALGGSFPAGT